MTQKLKTIFSDKYNLLLLLIMLIGFILRAVGISHGLPEIYNNDEEAYIQRAIRLGLIYLKIFSDNYTQYPFYLNQEFYYSSFLNILLFLYSLYFLVGKFFGYFQTITDFQNLFLHNYTPFVLIGRYVSVVFGTLTIPVIYVLTRRIGSKIAAILASFFLATNYLHINWSHTLKIEVTQLFFIVLAFIYILNIYERGGYKDYMFAGLLGGIAMSLRINGGILILFIFLARVLGFLKRENKLKISIFDKKIITAGILFGMCVIFINPFFIIKPMSFFSEIKHFLRGYGLGESQLLSINQPGHAENLKFFDLSKFPLQSQLSDNPFNYYLGYALKHGMGLPLEILSIVGIFYMAIRYGRPGFVLISFLMIYFIGLTSFSFQARHYIMPAVPFLIIAAAILLCDIIAKIRISQMYKQVITIIMAGFFTWIPIRDAVYFDILLTKKDTRQLAKEWIESNIPAGTKISVEKYDAVYGYVPHVAESKEEGYRKVEATIKSRLGGGIIRKARLDSLNYPEINYEIYEIGYNGVLKDYWNYYNFDKLVESNVRYVVETSWHFYSTTVGSFSSRPRQYNFYNALLTKAKMIKSFIPFKSGNEEFAITTTIPFEHPSVLSTWGPSIYIFELPE